MFPRLRITLAAALCVAWALCARATSAADDVVWVYPPQNSLVKESPVSIYGYLRGRAQHSLDARVMSAESSGGSGRQPLFVFRGKIFSGSISLEPGRNNVLVAGSVLQLYFKPDATSDGEGNFRLPAAHASNIEACNQCHTFSEGELALKQRLPDLCLSCHRLGAESDRSTLKKNKRYQSVTPDCLRCHEIHGSFEPKLLKKSKGICTDCHPSLAGYGHDPKRPGDGCGTCHDAHASAWPALLRGDALAACTKCHQKVVNPQKYPRSFHAPVSEGKCLDCHQSHPGSQPHLVKAAEPGLCRSCHKPKHEGPHQGKLENCRACHEAHQSTQPSLLTEGTWEPCLKCHPTQKASPTSHPPLKESCGGCHDAHNADRKNENRQTCGRCHRMDDPGFQSAHGGFPMPSTKNCSICHDSHNAKFPSLLRGTVHYPLKNGGCASCHLEKNGKLDLRYEGSTNCLRCHGQITGTSVVQELDKVHKPVSQIDCTACHNPHLGARPSLLLEEPVTLCGWCHGTVLRGVDNIHGVFEKGGTCYTCHLPHISDFRPLLKRPEAELCVRCHEKASPGDPRERNLVHGVVRNGHCTGCHNPHGTNTQKLLGSSGDALCSGCHKGVLNSSFEGTGRTGPAPWKFLHGPVASGNCTTCHELKHKHETVGDQFLATKGSRVCLQCHDTKPDHVRENFQSKMREVQNACLSCHLPHGGEDKYLLIPVK